MQHIFSRKNPESGRRKSGINRFRYSGKFRSGWSTSGCDHWWGCCVADMEQLVEEAFACVVDLRKFPKSTLELSLLVLENDGGLLGAALTALSCALTSAGIHMYDLLIGATCAAISAPAAHPHVQCGGDQSGEYGNSQTVRQARL